MQKINDGRDARRIIEARRGDQPNRYHDADDSDRFPAFTSNITDRSYPKDFKPVGIPKYDASKTRASGFIATLSQLRYLADPTPSRHSTSQ
jgi:hypothetical protein